MVFCCCCCLNAKIRKGTTLVFQIKGDYVLEMRSRGIMYIQTMTVKGFPWWLSGKKSACQCKKHGFDLWSEKIPYAMEQPSPWATTTWVSALEPGNHNFWSHVPKLLKPTCPRASALQEEKPLQPEALAPHLERNLRSPRREKAHWQQWRPSTTIYKYILKLTRKNIWLPKR